MISYRLLQSKNEYFHLLLEVVRQCAKTGIEDQRISRKNTDDIHFIGLALEDTISEIMNGDVLIGKRSLLEGFLELEREFCELLEEIGTAPEKYSVIPDSFILYYHSLLRTHVDITVKIQSFLRNNGRSTGKQEEDFISPEEFRSLLMNDVTN